MRSDVRGGAGELSGEAAPCGGRRYCSVERGGTAVWREEVLQCGGRRYCRGAAPVWREEVLQCGGRSYCSVEGGGTTGEPPRVEGEGDHNPGLSRSFARSPVLRTPVSGPLNPGLRVF
ncbi:hypothetical protein NQZ68_039856 [Dissostichus eleginoides]|nr:hypothetical protein NQZ68_039856 [Dissostichus eleginoides]